MHIKDTFLYFLNYFCYNMKVIKFKLNVCVGKSVKLFLLFSKHSGSVKG